VGIQSLAEVFSLSEWIFLVAILVPGSWSSGNGSRRGPAVTLLPSPGASFPE